MNMEKMSSMPNGEEEVVNELRSTLNNIAKEDSIDVSPADIQYVARMLVKTFAEQNDPLELSEIRDMNAETRRTFRKYLVGRGNVSPEIDAAEKMAVINDRNGEVIGTASDDRGIQKVIGEERPAA